MDQMDNLKDKIGKLENIANLWADGHDAAHIRSEKLKEYSEVELKQIESFHFIDSGSYIYSNPVFFENSWSDTGIGPAPEAHFAFEHLEFVFEYLMPLSMRIESLVAFEDPSSLMDARELVASLWPELGTSSNSLGSFVEEAMSNWRPTILDVSLDSSGEEVETISFDKEMLSMAQLHAFLRLFLDTYVRELGMGIEIIAVYDSDESAQATAVFLRKVGVEESSLTLNYLSNKL